MQIAMQEGCSYIGTRYIGNKGPLVFTLELGVQRVVSCTFFLQKRWSLDFWILTRIPTAQRRPRRVKRWTAVMVKTFNRPLTWTMLPRSKAVLCQADVSGQLALAEGDSIKIIQTFWQLLPWPSSSGPHGLRPQPGVWHIVFPFSVWEIQGAHMARVRPQCLR